MRLIVLIAIIFSQNIFAQNKKVKYEYKKYEKFDLGSMNIAGDNSSPGDISISPRFRKNFRNRLPLRKNFNKEMLKAIDTVK